MIESIDAQIQAMVEYARYIFECHFRLLPTVETIDGWGNFRTGITQISLVHLATGW
jgi:hypothetical protein